MRCISASSLSLYNSCPYCWWMKYVAKCVQEENDALKIGIAFHKCLELFDKKIPKDEIFKRIKKDLIIKNTDQEIDNYALVRDMAEIYFKDPIKGTVLETEKKFSLKLDGIPVPLFGYIDKVMEGYDIVDYKTTSKDFKQEDIDTIQTLCYSYVMWKFNGKIPQVTFYVINKKKIKKPTYKPQILIIKKSTDDVIKFPRICEDFYEKVQAKKFEPSKEPHFSPFKGMCPTAFC